MSPSVVLTFPKSLFYSSTHIPVFLLLCLSVSNEPMTSTYRGSPIINEIMPADIVCRFTNANRLYRAATITTIFMMDPVHPNLSIIFLVNHL